MPDSNTSDLEELQSDPEKPSLFVNILIHDASEAIKAKVRASLVTSTPSTPSAEDTDDSDTSHSPDSTDSVPPSKPNDNTTSSARHRMRTKVLTVAQRLLPRTDSMIRRKIAGVASRRVATDFDYALRLTETVSETVVSQIRTLLREKGIHGCVRQVFTQGPYLVLELQVQFVDTKVFDPSLHSNKPLQPSSTMWRTLGQMTSAVEQEFLPARVQSHIANTLAAQLQQKLSERLLITDTVVVAEPRQARYFYSYIQELRRYETVVLGELVTSTAPLSGSSMHGKRRRRKQKPVPPPLPEPISRLA